MAGLADARREAGPRRPRLLRDRLAALGGGGGRGLLAEDLRTRIAVRFDGETASRSLGRMADVFEKGELDRRAVVSMSQARGAHRKFSDPFNDLRS
jgi:hypothetical protein